MVKETRSKLLKVIRQLMHNKINVIIFIIFFLYCIINGYSFYTLSFFRQFMLITIIAAGVFIQMLCGDFDLSFAAQIAASTVLIVLLKRQGFPIGVVLILILAANGVIGVLKGFLIGALRMPSIIMTLALQIIFSKFFEGLTNGNSIMLYEQKALYGNMYFGLFSAALFILLLLVCRFFLHQTYYGKYGRMIGENIELVEKSGLNTTAILIVIHMLASVYFTAAAFLMVSWTGSGSINMGTSYLFKVLAALFLGGVGYRNGKGELSGVIIGSASMVMLVFLILNSGQSLFYETIIEGLIILWSVTICLKK